jgi:hypothetical protein
MLIGIGVEGVVEDHPSSGFGKAVLGGVMAPVVGVKMVVAPDISRGSMFGSNHGFTHIGATGGFPFAPEGL